MSFDQADGMVSREPLTAMYPDVYYSVYPVVQQMCDMYDNPSNPDFYPHPSRSAVERLADDIYYSVVGDPMMMQEGRGLLRALILILLIRELIRRRGPVPY